jgi:hypothetical protein
MSGKYAKTLIIWVLMRKHMSSSSIAFYHNIRI